MYFIGTMLFIGLIGWILKFFRTFRKVTISHLENWLSNSMEELESTLDQIGFVHHSISNDKKSQNFRRNDGEVIYMNTKLQTGKKSITYQRLQRKDPHYFLNHLIESGYMEIEEPNFSALSLDKFDIQSETLNGQKVYVKYDYQDFIHSFCRLFSKGDYWVIHERGNASNSFIAITLCRK